MTKFRIFILIIAILSLYAGPVSAHSPYAVKVKTIQGPSDESLIIEKLFGDGIFVSDPVSLQVRNKNGAVIAYTPTSTHVGVFCPSIKFCWAFPYNPYLPFSSAWRVDFKNLDYGKKIEPVKGKEDLKFSSQFQDYLTNKKTKRIHSYWQPDHGSDDPFSRKGSEGFTESSSLVLKLMSPIFIILDQIITLAVLAVICLFPFILYPAYARFISTKQGALKITFRVFAWLLGLAYFGFFLVASFIMSFTLSAPMGYMLLVTLLSVGAGNKFIKRSRKQADGVKESGKAGKVLKTTAKSLVIVVFWALGTLFLFGGTFKLVYQHRENFLALALINYAVAALLIPPVRRVIAEKLKVRLSPLVTIILVVGLLTAYSYIPHEVKGISAATYTSYSTEQLIGKIESHFQHAKERNKNIESWLDSKGHFILARTYFTLGEDEKAQHHLSQIKEIRDRRILVRPFMNVLLAAVRRDDIEKVISAIKDSDKNTQWINSVRYTRDLYDPEFGTTVGEPLKADWLEKTLCDMAAKKLAVKKEYASLDTLGQLDQCAPVRFRMFQSQLASLIRDRKYIDAYKLAENAEKPVPLAGRFEVCIPKLSDGNNADQEFMNFLLHEGASGEETKNFDKILTIAELLRIFGHNDEAFEVLKKAEVTEKSQAAAIPIFESYYMAEKEDKALEVADYMKTFNKEPILTGGFGTKNPHQWWVRAIPEGDVLAQNPTSFGLGLAMKIKNDKARFTVMKEIFLNLGDRREDFFPGCQKAPGVCIIDELSTIAAHEDDEWDRDTMYGFLSEMAKLQGDKERSEEFLGKIVDLKRMQCTYDMCNGGTVRPLRLQSDIAPKRPSILDDLLADKIEFNLIPTPFEDMAKSLQALSNRLNDTNEDFRDVSSQSGYRIGYLDKHPVSVSSNRRLEPCDID